MGDTPYPLPRQTRESTVLVGDGTVGPYGPSLYKVFDTADVKVWAKASGESSFSDVTDSVTITKTDGDAFDTFSVLFDAALPATTQWYHQAARVAERDLAVTRAGSIISDQLEKELSKVATALSELRRDVDRSWRSEIGGLGQQIAPAANLILGWNADGTFIENKAPIDLGLETLPAAAQAYLRRNAGNTGFEAMTAADVWTDLSATRGFNQAATGQIKQSLGARYHRVADVMRVGGEAIKHNGELGADGTGGFLWDDYGGSTGPEWMEARAILSVSGKASSGYGPAISGSLLGPGTANIHTLFLTEAPDESVITNGFADYVEVRRGLLRAITRGMEMDSVNLLVSPATGAFHPYGSMSALGSGAGTTYGLVMASGGGGPGVAAENVYDSDVAIQITGNGAYWWTGLNFSAGGLKTEVDGRMHAIKMAHNQALEWHSYSDHALAASIVSLISAETYKQELQFSNSGLSYINAAGNALFRLGTNATAANGFVFTPANALGYARFDPLTSDANGGGVLRGKGTGGWLLQDGSGNTVVAVAGAKKLGLFGVAPAVQPTVTGALSSIADTAVKDVLTSLIAGLASYGAALDGTT